ncbi:hypothetical protein TRFO_29376 [Tritrichomonas foetus]|uniref:PH domain-containing protein n=1 Tax=Tritrichomonas foetus TaxID=1144522 RepID=A0A1J4K0L3_9EUKA|nr:hypothetical protein TRFO_29376 [Tritrichomonas foetus]|eukprot:OHT03284.1 hypothetical protein TRFO_29376 [Tritrichomonas foetus]
MTNSPDSSSWIGKPPPLSSNEILINLPKFTYPPNFVQDFQSNPSQTISNLQSNNPDYSQLANDCYLSKFLFYCPDISFNSITNFFISRPKNTKSLFFFYFCSINLDYLDIADAARFVLSRISFPENPTIIKLIFEAFADAYCSSNQYITVSASDVANMARAAILYSMKKQGTESMSKDEFTNLICNIPASKDAKNSFYESIRRSPIPLFFTFLNPKIEPEMKKVGHLTKVGGIFKKKSKVLFSLIQSEIQYFKDTGSKEPAGGIEIENTITTYVPQAQKEQAHMVIRRIDGAPFGYSLSKGQKKPSKKTQHSLFAKNEQELTSWISMLNYVAVYTTLYKSRI